MFRKRSLRLALLISAAIGTLTPGSVHATAIANSQISFSNLQIVPASGTVVFLDVWTAEAFAQAQNSLGQLVSQFNSSTGGAATANATVNFATAHGDASAVNLGANASSSVNIPGTTTAAASSMGFGTLSNSFLITGGSGNVQVNFSVNLTGSLNVFTDAFGRKAETETIFDLELDGTPVLFRNDLLSIGPNSSNSRSFSQALLDTRTLQFNTPSFIVALVDSESLGINQVPEPSSITVLLAGLVVLGALRRRYIKSPEIKAGGLAK
jgi:hypothetical protein